LLIPESFELLLKYGKSSLLRKQESSLFKAFWIPAYAGMTKWGYFSKVSTRKLANRRDMPFSKFLLDYYRKKI